MEAVAAISSIIQVAQFGTQLSVGLYKVADGIASANKETQYIAKDIALFCQVLNHLAKTLERGQQARIFRQNAFDTSLNIVKECKSVFDEIQDVLMKATKGKDPLRTDFRLPHGEKFLWMFRKGKVEFFRGVLESLKSTMLVELAVLDYTVTISSHPMGNAVDMNGLLALKSLVLADETAKQSLRDLIQSDPANLDPSLIVASYGVTPEPPKDVPDSVSREIYNPPEDRDNGCTAFNKAVNPGHYALGLSEPAYKTPYWSRKDRLEFAQQKLELARWEYQRLEENIALEARGGSSARPGQHALLRHRIYNDLVKFGMKDDLIDLAITTLDESSISMLPERTTTYQFLPAAHRAYESLTSSGLAARLGPNSANQAIMLRWLPDMFSDVLYEHTQSLLEKAGLPRQRVDPVFLTKVKSEAAHTNDCMAGNLQNHAISSGTSSDLPYFPRAVRHSIGERRGTNLYDQISRLETPSTRRPQKMVLESSARHSPDKVPISSPQWHRANHTLHNSESGSHSSVDANYEPTKESLPEISLPVPSLEPGRFGMIPPNYSTVRTKHEALPPGVSPFVQHEDHSTDTTDKHLKIVQDLIKQWTFVDSPELVLPH